MSSIIHPYSVPLLEKLRSIFHKQFFDLLLKIDQKGWKNRTHKLRLKDYTTPKSLESLFFVFQM